MIGTVALLGLLLNPQGASTAKQNDPPPPPPAATSAAAVRAAQPPAIDGRDADPVWRTAHPITDFRQWQPTEGAPARFPSEATVAYDASYLYVLVRAFDPHPDSIITQLARRDTFTPTDMVWLFIDSYHDRRTGFEFGVNPSGVRLDAAIYDDGNEDFAWDAVWDVATRIDSLGWTAEFRIPLSQLRYGEAADHTFGFTVDRDIYRYNERTSWPMISQAKAGFVSQFGTLTGLAGLEAPRRLELSPYAVTKNVTRIAGTRFARGQEATVGADVKYRVASNLTLDATVNPDFGQVEADPAVLNLTAFETFFSERRPFFVAGQGLFRFDVNCTAVNDCSTGEGLFYSRRIGRAPQLAGTYSDTTSPAFTTILGAGKLTGRLPGGLRVGMLDAVTRKTSGVGGATLEPGTNYSVVRLQQDFRGGNSTVGGIVTAVNRGLDSYGSPYLRRTAYVGAVDFRHRFLKNTYELSGSLDFSRVAGSAEVIAATQRSAVHYYQRPDAGLPYDSLRTSLAGNSQELKLGKVGGQHVLFQTSYMRRSAGFEINDLGYLQRADEQTWSTWAGYFDRHQRKLYNRFQWNMNWWQWWTAAGLPLERAYNTNVHLQLRNNWWFHLGGTWGQLGMTYDDRAARGGPAVRQDPYFAPWGGINGDDRKWIVPYLWVNYFRGDAGRNTRISLSPELDFKVSTRLSSSMSLDWSHNITNNQWFGNFTDSLGGSHYTFAHLNQHTVGITARLNYTITPNMSLQVYAQPFVSKGTYGDVRELSATPRAARYDDRYRPYADTTVTNAPGGFNFKQFRSNVVFRWEYRHGSTLFLVWSQGRQGYDGVEGTRDFQGDVRDLFRLHPDNTFLVKVSYWLNR
jgi:hypothetical protein